MRASLLTACVFGAGVLLSSAPGLRAGEEQEEIRLVRELGEKCVFRLDATNQGGSVVLIDKEEDGAVGLFATCYHVLHKQRDFTVSSAKDVLIARSDTARCLIDRADDLVLFKAKLEAREVEAVGEVLARAGGVRRSFALGYPFFNANRLVAVPIRLEGSGDLAYVQPRQTTGKSLPVLFHMGEQLCPGMSGGLIVEGTEQGPRFAGLTLGRLHAPVGFVLPRKTVDEARKGAADTAALSPFAAPLVEAPPPYANAHSAFVYNGSASWAEDRKSWSAVEGWQAMFGNENRLRESFQEAEFSLQAMPPAPAGERGRPALALRVDPASFLGDDDKVEVWVNHAHRVEVTRKNLDRPVELGGLLSAGENLVILVKKHPRKGELTVNQLLEQNTLDVRLERAGRPVFRLERSIPSAVDRYAVYLTLLNGEPESRLGDGEDEFGANARLALRADFVARTLDGSALELPLTLGDRLAGSRIDGVVGLKRPRDFPFAAFEAAGYPEKAFQPAGFVAVRPHSRCTVDVAAMASLSLRQTRVKFGGFLQVNVPEGETPLLVESRLQVVRTPDDGFLLVPRTLNGWLPRQDDRRFLIPVVGNEQGGLSLDVGGLVREGLLSWINDEGLHPDVGTHLVPTLGELFADGLKESGVTGLNVRLRHVSVRERDGQPWFVFLFRVAEEGDARGKATLTEADVLPDRDVPAELLLKDVPVRAAEGLRPLLNGPPERGLPEKVLAGKAATVRLTVTKLPDNKTPAEPTPLDVARPRGGLEKRVVGSLLRLVKGAKKSFEVALDETPPGDVRLKRARLALDGADGALTLAAEEVWVGGAKRVSGLAAVLVPLGPGAKGEQRFECRDLRGKLHLPGYESELGPNPRPGTVALNAKGGLDCDLTVVLGGNAGTVRIVTTDNRPAFQADLNLTEVKPVQDALRQAISGLGNAGGVTVKSVRIDTLSGVVTGEGRVTAKETKRVVVEAFGKKVDETVVLFDLSTGFDFTYDVNKDEARIRLQTPLKDVVISERNLKERLGPEVKPLLGK